CPGGAAGVFDALVELRRLRLGQELARLVDRVAIAAIHLGGGVLEFLSVLAHESPQFPRSMPSTSMPIERAVPAMERIAASTSVVLRSGIFVVAVSRSCFLVILPPVTLCGSFEPEPGFFWVASPAAFLIRIGAGGVLVMNGNDRAENTVISTGIGTSAFACARLRALHCLQNSMMWTPCWPSAGPMGGDGLALPAGTCNLMK